MKHNVKQLFVLGNTKLKQVLSLALEPANEIRLIHFYSVKLLAVIYLIAFVSLLTQVNGLFSPQGILPIANVTAMLNQQGVGWFEWPHLFFAASSEFLVSLLLIGCVASVCLLFGIVPLLSTIICWVIYLSFVNCGSVFMSFQWDILLLEVSFLFCWAMPITLLWKSTDAFSPPRIVVWAMWVCCFRLMITSGWVKIASKDQWWRQLRALDIHYWTQPLPHKLSWYVHQLPSWFDKGCVALILCIECVAPCLIWTTKKLRCWVGLLFISLMVAVMLTGNYCFFNLLTIVLALYLFQDSVFRTTIKTCQSNHSLNKLRAIIATSLIVIGLSVDLARFLPANSVVGTAYYVMRYTQPFRLINQYGLFASMTTTRNEIEIWASMDQKNWQPYQFKYKPNNAQDPPRFTWFHQPRLDWQMWFVALRGYSQQSWVNRLALALFNQSTAVERLFESVPFNTAPNYVVFTQSGYTFSTFKQRSHSDNWWVKQPTQAFSPVLQKP